jgi:hypothetical protein
MEVEEHGINYSTNDRINVTINNALGATTYEFLETYYFILKETGSKGRESKYLPSSVQVFSLFREIL